METYKERILRYRVVRCAHMTRELVAEYRINDIEVPEDEIRRELVWSFHDLETAKEQCAEENERLKEYFGEKHPEYLAKTWYDVIDGGQETVVERMAWF